MARRKPHNPAEDMRLRLEQAAARTERDRLKATGVDVEIVTEMIKDEDSGTMKKHWVAKGQRKDVFRTLLDRRALDQAGFDAVRKYEEALDTAMGHNTPERRPDHIRASVEGAPGQSVSQEQIKASRRIRWIEDRLPRNDMKLLTTLRMNIPAQWRHVVQMVTGETNDDCHASRIRAMAQNLRDAHASCDADEKKRKREAEERHIQKAA